MHQPVRGHQHPQPARHPLCRVHGGEPPQPGLSGRQVRDGPAARRADRDPRVGDRAPPLRLPVRRVSRRQRLAGQPLRVHGLRAAGGRHHGPPRGGGRPRHPSPRGGRGPPRPERASDPLGRGRHDRGPSRAAAGRAAPGPPADHPGRQPRAAALPGRGGAAHRRRGGRVRHVRRGSRRRPHRRPGLPAAPGRRRPRHDLLDVQVVRRAGGRPRAHQLAGAGRADRPHRLPRAHRQLRPRPHRGPRRGLRRLDRVRPRVCADLHCERAGPGRGAGRGRMCGAPGRECVHLVASRRARGRGAGRRDGRRAPLGEGKHPGQRHRAALATRRRRLQRPAPGDAGDHALGPAAGRHGGGGAPDVPSAHRAGDTRAGEGRRDRAACRVPGPALRTRRRPQLSPGARACPGRAPRPASRPGAHTRGPGKRGPSRRRA